MLSTVEVGQVIKCIFSVLSPFCFLVQWHIQKSGHCRFQVKNVRLHHLRFVLCIYCNFYPQLKIFLWKMHIYCNVMMMCLVSGAVDSGRSVHNSLNARQCARYRAQSLKQLSSHNRQHCFPNMPCCLNVRFFIYSMFNLFSTEICFFVCTQ